MNSFTGKWGGTGLGGKLQAMDMDVRGEWGVLSVGCNRKMEDIIENFRPKKKQ